MRGGQLRDTVGDDRLWDQYIVWSAAVGPRHVPPPPHHGAAVQEGQHPGESAHVERANTSSARRKLHGAAKVARVANVLSPPTRAMISPTPRRRILGQHARRQIARGDLLYFRRDVGPTDHIHHSDLAREWVRRFLGLPVCHAAVVVIGITPPAPHAAVLQHSARGLASKRHRHHWGKDPGPRIVVEGNEVGPRPRRGTSDGVAPTE